MAEGGVKPAEQKKKSVKIVENFTMNEEDFSKKVKD